MGTRRLVQVDASTGEIAEGVVAYVVPKRKNGFQEGGWLAMAQNALEAIAKADLGDDARRVLFLLLAHLEFENWIVTPQKELADTIGMQPSNFSRALSRLIQEGIILKGPKLGRHNSLRLNPRYGWKGAAKGHVVALADYTDASRRAELEAAGQQRLEV